MRANHKIIVAISGGGRTLENLLAYGKKTAAYEICGVVSSSADCRGVTTARAAGLDVFIDPFTSNNADVATRLYHWIDAKGAGWVALAGFIRVFPVRKEWRDRIVNIHPALLPRFGGRGMYGKHVHQAVLAAGEAWSGASVHYVNDRYDEGEIIAQIKVPVRSDDDAEALAARVFDAECKLYPQVLAALMDGSLPLPNHKVKFYENK